MKKLILSITLIVSSYVFPQVGIGTDSPDTSSILELKSDNTGLLLPRIKLKSNTDIITIKDPAIGLIVYNLKPVGNETGVQYNGVVMWNGLEWRTLSNKSLENGTVNQFDCSNTQLKPATYTANTPYNGSLEVPYDGANGGVFSDVVLGPNNGLTATLKSGNLNEGSGSLYFSITGTPQASSPSTTTFTIQIGDSTCDAIVGAGDNIDIGGLVYYKTKDIPATVSGSGDYNSGTQDIGWISYYDNKLPVIGGKLRLDGYFASSSNATSGRVSLNPRLVNVTDKNVKFWFAAMTTVDRFNGGNIVLTPGSYINLDNGIYLNQGHNNTLTNPTTVKSTSNNDNEIVTLDLALDEKWYRIYYYPYVDNNNNSATGNTSVSVNKIYMSVQRLY